ncbi:MAG: toll/interleukin-1 receptor domain-containing protein, partial [Clostridia bacterium]|nr:toll/interleukin-1 receptor domain-containing protein [Clostridia bacterium]
MPTAYEGTKPYIFVSYSHKDKAEVIPYINALEKAGFRIWFDGGIEAGSEWPEFIANPRANRNCVVSFISKNFDQSKTCQRELTFAQNLNK